MKKFLVLACLFLFFTACGSGNAETQPSPDPTEYSQQNENEPPVPTNHEDEEPQEPPSQQEVVFPTDEFEDPFEGFIDPDNLFELTSEQQALFDEYTRDFNFDISIFRGVDPIDVAHVFIECGINGLWEGEYYLYYFESEPLTKQELYDEFEHDMRTEDIRTRRSVANITFPNLNDGTFVDLGDGFGYIEFLSVDSDMVNVFEATLRLNMRLVDDVWMINLSRFLQSAEDDNAPLEDGNAPEENDYVQEDDNYTPE